MAFPGGARFPVKPLAAVHLLRPSIFLFFFFSFLFPHLVLSVSDSESLIAFKKSLNDPNKALDSWNTDTVPCTKDGAWPGVICFKGIVTGLRLEKMGLSGTIDVDALHEITGLRTLSITSNSFQGPIPDFNRLGALKAIFLSGNKFSGEIPSDYFSKMESLKKVWLANNGFTGKIPTSLSQLPHLMELHLDNNQFSGPIPAFTQPSLSSLDLSYNKLEGEIPSPLSKFDKKSFQGNDGLCGEKLGKDCNAPKVVDPATGAGAAGGDQATPPPSPDVASHPANPENTKLAAATVTLISMLLLLVFAAILVMKRRKEEFDVLGRENLDEPLDLHVSSSNSNRRGMESSRKGMDASRKGGSNHGSSKNSGMGDLVVVNDERGIFRLPDLMKAAAEVLGNGSLGSAYKAVMSSGVAVVVKRMREMNRLGKDGFDMEIRQLGRLRHRNILTPLAYHYRKEEKLLIYEYVPKGSLLYLLHGDRGPSHAELDWPARLKIVQGIARGMGFLHTELSSYNLPHGNLKSSNILLGSDYEPLLADYGFCPVVNTAQAAQAMLAYKAPESLQYRHVSPKCDVYCLGIVILEILTGKFPSQYLNNGKGGTDVVQWVLSAIQEGREAELFDPEIAGSQGSLGEMERLLHIGADCVEQNPEQRPDMKEAIRRIEDIKVEGAGGQGGSGGAGMQSTPSLRDGYAGGGAPLDQSSSNSYPSHALDVFDARSNDHSSR